MYNVLQGLPINSSTMYQSHCLYYTLINIGHVAFYSLISLQKLLNFLDWIDSHNIPFTLF